MFTIILFLSMSVDEKNMLLLFTNYVLNYILPTILSASQYYIVTFPFKVIY